MSQRHQSTLAGMLGMFIGAVFVGMLMIGATAADAQTAQDNARTVTIAALPCEDTDGNVACYYVDDTGEHGTMVTTFYPLGAEWPAVHPASVVCYTDTRCHVTYTP